MLQPAGDLGLEQEPLAADGVVGVMVEDLLERHLAVQLGVERHEHRPQPAPGVRPEDAEPLAVAGGRADGVGGGAVGVAVLGRQVTPTWPSVASTSGSPIRPGSRGSSCRPRPRPGSSRRRRRALQVDVGQGLQQGPLGRSQVPAGFQVVGEAPGLVERPRLERGHELALVDEAVLKGEQAEQEMTVGGVHGETPGRDGVPAR